MIFGYGSIDRLASSSSSSSSPSNHHRTLSYNNFTTSAFATKRSTSYGSGSKLNDTGTTSLRRYDNDHIPTYERRTSYTPSHYTTSGYSSSSYGTLPRYNRAQTPNYINRDRNFTSNREYKSMSRFSTDRERSEPDDNSNQRFEKYYNRYVKDENVQNNHSTNDTKYCKLVIQLFSNLSMIFLNYFSETETEVDDEETEEEGLYDENELKDVLRDIAKLNEDDISEDIKLKTPRCSKEKEILSDMPIIASNSISTPIGL
ncbi:hypothetical protein DINM_000477 [Dirofilaria immitis]|nr:hypothetical protein [Dirofilaria immitis]